MMEKLLQTNTPVVQSATSAQSSIKVCMHVLGCARTDVRVMREATALVEAGFDVSIIDIEGDPALPTEEEIQGVSVKHIIMPNWFTPTCFKPYFLIKATQMFVYRIVRLMNISADVYHAHDETALLACYIAARLQGKPLIFDAHEIPLFQLPLSEMNRGRRWLRLLSALLLRHIIPHSAGIITVSPPIAQEIYNLYHGPEVTLIRNIPAYREVKKNDRLRQYLGLGPETRIALYQGGLWADRQLDRLIRAARFLEQDIVMVMMGDGSKETISQLKALILSEGVTDRVKIISAVPYEELLDWTASADLGLIVYSPDYSLNVQMCLPNKLFEYLMAGLPILSSQLDAVAEIINIYNVGQIVSSLAPADVSAAINAMLRDPAALDRMHHNALEAVRYEINWEKESQVLVHLYQIILKQEGRKRHVY